MVAFYHRKTDKIIYLRSIIWVPGLCVGCVSVGRSCSTCKILYHLSVLSVFGSTIVSDFLNDFGFCPVKCVMIKMHHSPSHVAFWAVQSACPCNSREKIQPTYAASTCAEAARLTTVENLPRNGSTRIGQIKNTDFFLSSAFFFFFLNETLLQELNGAVHKSFTLSLLVVTTACVTKLSAVSAEAGVQHNPGLSSLVHFQLQIWANNRP